MHFYTHKNIEYKKMTNPAYGEFCTLTEFFNFVDTNHDGFITISEIKNDNLCKSMIWDCKTPM